MAYAEDTKGDEIYTVYVIDIETGTSIGKPLVGVTASVEWAGNEALVYITMDEILRPDKVYDYPAHVLLLVLYYFQHKLGETFDRCTLCL